VFKKGTLGDQVAALRLYAK